MFRDDSEALRARLVASDARVEDLTADLARTRERLDAIEKELAELRTQVHRFGVPLSKVPRRLGMRGTAALGLVVLAVAVAGVSYLLHTLGG